MHSGICPRCGREMTWVADIEFVCECGESVVIPWIHDYSWKWKPGMVWVSCPNCRGSDGDGIYVYEWIGYNTCELCGTPLEIDRERRK